MLTSSPELWSGFRWEFRRGKFHAGQQSVKHHQDECFTKRDFKQRDSSLSVFPVPSVVWDLCCAVSGYSAINSLHQHSGNRSLHEETPPLPHLRALDRSSRQWYFGGEYYFPTVHLCVWDSQQWPGPPLPHVFVSWLWGSLGGPLPSSVGVDYHGFRHTKVRCCGIPYSWATNLHDQKICSLGDCDKYCYSFDVLDYVFHVNVRTGRSGWENDVHMPRKSQFFWNSTSVQRVALLLWAAVALCCSHGHNRAPCPTPRYHQKWDGKDQGER